MLLEKRLDSADPGGEDDAAALGSDLRVAGVLPRELRRCDGEVREPVGAPCSKSGTSPATFTGRSDGSNRWIVRIPFRPLIRPVQNSSIPVPTGVTGPMPVMRTLRLVTMLLDARPPRLGPQL